MYSQPKHRCTVYEILGSATQFIADEAQTLGIDGYELLANLPPPGTLVTGRSVPVLHKKYQHCCSVLWFHNQTKDGQEWPFLRLHTFKHGGKVFTFNGLRWLNTNQHGLRHRTPSAAVNRTSLPKEQVPDWRSSKYEQLSAQYGQSPVIKESEPWLHRRLCGLATSRMLERTEMRMLRDKRVVIPLHHPEHGISGFHQITHREAGDVKRHYVKQRGWLKGSYAHIGGDNSWPIALCEGVVTALTIATVWPGPIRIALFANNLASVRVHTPGDVVIFHDQDLWKPNVGNVGKRQAVAATRPEDSLHGPQFSPLALKYRPTDFNDLVQLDGFIALQRQIGMAMLMQMNRNFSQYD